MDIFIDESGFNGVDLLGNPKGPEANSRAFVLATHSIPENQCRELKEKHFGGVKALSLKHKDLGRRTSNQERVLSFMRDLRCLDGQVRIYIAHKKFALTRKLVDLIIEQVAHEGGYNLYKDRRDVWIATAIYFLIPNYEGDDYFDQMLAAFQSLMRNRTRSHLNALIMALASRRLTPGSQRLLEPIIQLVQHPKAMQFFRSVDKDALDISLSVTLSLMGLWRGSLGDSPSIRLVHDQSSNMSKHSSWWDYLNHPGRPAYSESTPYEVAFPAGIDETLFVDDKDWAGIQLADVAAGAVHRASSWVARGRDPFDAYGEQLMDVIGSYSDDMIVCQWPDEEILTGNLSLDGQDLLPALAYHMNLLTEFRNHEKKGE